MKKSKDMTHIKKTRLAIRVKKRKRRDLLQQSQLSITLGSARLYKAELQRLLDLMQMLKRESKD